MPPKRPAAEDAPAKEKTPDALPPRRAHPSTAVMVKEALSALDSRKGVSSPAVHNYIKQKYPSVDVARLKHLVRRALRKGIETGALVRPATSNATSTRRFRLAPKVKEPKPKTENADPNVRKEPEEKDGAPKKPPKTGAKKKEATQEEGRPQKDSKPPKRSKQDEEAGPSKVAPAKKPKGKKVSENGKVEGPSAAAKPKAGKAPLSKAVKKGSDASAAKTTGKRGRKAAE